MKAIAIIQARSTSTRFPRKVLAKLNKNTTVLDLLTSRLRSCKNLDWIPFLNTQIPGIIVAIPNNDCMLIKYCKEEDTLYFQGSENNVMKRVLDCAKEYEADIIVDITADCPFVDPYHVDALVSMVKDGYYDYASNIDLRTWPDGFDVQVYKTELLQTVYNINPNAPHCGWQILNNKHQLIEERKVGFFNLAAPRQITFPEMRLTLDTKEDLEVLREVYKGVKWHASAIEIINFMRQNPELQKINAHCKPKDPMEG
jgi:spore coat polysaccharide biosynthesis protein SpsF